MNLSEGTAKNPKTVQIPTPNGMEILADRVLVKKLADFSDTRHNKISYRNRVFIVFSIANINKKTLPRKGKCFSSTDNR